MDLERIKKELFRYFYFYREEMLSQYLMGVDFLSYDESDPMNGDCLTIMVRYNKDNSKYNISYRCQSISSDDIDCEIHESIQSTNYNDSVNGLVSSFISILDMVNINVEDIHDIYLFVSREKGYKYNSVIASNNTIFDMNYCNLKDKVYDYTDPELCCYLRTIKAGKITPSGNMTEIYCNGI